jgi:hypothetical protein
MHVAWNVGCIHVRRGWLAVSSSCTGIEIDDLGCGWGSCVMAHVERDASATRM